MPASVAGPVPGAQRHGHEAAGQAVLGGDQAGLEVGSVVGERVDGALHEAEDRAAAQLVGSAGDRRRHLDDVARRLLAHRRHRLEVLARVRQHGLGVVQRLGRRRHVLRGDDRAPVVAHRRQGVDEAGGGGGVLLRRRPLLARLVVEDEDAAAVVREVAVPAVDEHVGGGVAAGEDVFLRRAGERLLDDRAREAHDLRGAIDDAAASFEDIQSPLAGEADARLAQDLEGGFADPFELGGREHVPAQLGLDGVDADGHGRQPRCGVSAGIGALGRRGHCPASAVRPVLLHLGEDAVEFGLDPLAQLEGARLGAQRRDPRPEPVDERRRALLHPVGVAVVSNRSLCQISRKCLRV